MTTPLACRRLAPIPVLGAVFVPLLVLAAARKPIDSAYIMLVLLLAFAAVGAYCERRRAVGGLALDLALLAAAILLENAVIADGLEPPAIEDFVFIA